MFAKVMVYESLNIDGRPQSDGHAFHDYAAKILPLSVFLGLTTCIYDTRYTLR